MSLSLKYGILNLILIGIVMTGCKTQNVSPNNDNVFIGDLRDIPRIGGQRTHHERLIILIIDKKQTVFEVTEKNSMALSDIPTSYIDKMGIVMNDDGNYDTKYDMIITLTLKKKALGIVNAELREQLK